MDAFCLASGPSLTPDDVELVRQWRGHDQERLVIVANTTFRLAPWADALFAMDRPWWNAHADELRSFRGARYSSSRQDANLGVTELTSRDGFSSFGNSGAGAIALAMYLGCGCIYLLGYDAKMQGTRKHWHGDHPAGLSNALSMPNWAGHFARLAKHAKERGVLIINCTRDTALTCFERMTLEDVLSCQSSCVG